MTESRLRMLPDRPKASADTELVWVDGVAFVNAEKHEQVVTACCTERDKWKGIAKEAGLHGDPQDPSQSIANVNEAYRLMRIQRDCYLKALNVIHGFAKNARSKDYYSALLSIESVCRAALQGEKE